MKKLKLLFSFASLCIAFSVLAFGVMAATSVNYTLSGSITYTVSNAYINLTTRVYKFGDYTPQGESKVVVDAPEDADDLKAVADLFAGKSTEQVATIAAAQHLTQVGSDYTYNSYTGAASGVSENNGELLTSGLNLTLNTDDAKAFYIVVTLENLGTNTINATLSTADFFRMDGQTKVDVSAADSNILQYKEGRFPSIAGHQTVDMVLALAIADIRVDIPTLQMECAMDSTDGELQSEQLQALDVSQAEQGLFFLNMGYTSYTDENTNTPLKWRLVHAEKNGVEIPITSSTTKTDLMGAKCVFVQEVTVTNGIPFSLSTNNQAGRYSNDYYVSNIREYLNNGYMDLLHIDANSIVYKAISKRTIVDLYSDIRWNIKEYTINEQPLPDEAQSEDCADALWLLSANEIDEYYGYDESTDLSINAACKDSNGVSVWYWLRSPAYNSSGMVYIINCGGERHWDGPTATGDSVRAAFQIVL